MKQKRRRLDWNPDIEERPHQETMDEEMLSLVHPHIRSRFLAAASVFGLFQNDIQAETAYAQRCPKCDHHSLVREQPGDPKSPWRCNRCGNDADEFGNKL